MSKSNTIRVFLGKPYNRAFWWNTALRILNEKHRGKHDIAFTRKQHLPDAANKGGYQVGGVGTGNVLLKREIRV